MELFLLNLHGKEQNRHTGKMLNLLNIQRNRNSVTSLKKQMYITSDFN